MQKLKVLLCVTLLCFFYSKSIAQLSLMLPQPPPFAVSLKNLLNVGIINADGKNYSVSLIGKVYAEDKKQIAEFRTNTFSIKGHLFNVNYEDIHIAYQDFDDPAFQNTLQTTGYFPIGKFYLCVDLYMEEGPKVAEKCVETIRLPIQPPRLVFPRDTSTVKGDHPVLTWLPVFVSPVLQHSIKYQIAITEMIADQTPAEAILNNSDNIVANDLSNTFFLYPPTAMTLKYDSWYAWQVKAYSGDYFIGESEVWKFKPIKDSIRIKKADTSAVELKSNVDGGFYRATGKIYFKYTAKYHSQKLNLKIYDDHLNIVKEPKKVYRQYPGDHLYTVDLTKFKNMKNKGYYVLQVIDEKGEKYYLRFQYINPNSLTEE